MGIDVLSRGSDGYEANRGAFNVLLSQDPAAIVTPRDAGDVAAAIAYAKAEGLRVGAQRTGHSAEPLGDLSGTLLLRTAGMNGVLRRCRRPGLGDPPALGRDPPRRRRDVPQRPDPWSDGPSPRRVPDVRRQHRPRPLCPGADQSRLRGAVGGDDPLGRGPLSTSPTRPRTSPSPIPQETVTRLRAAKSKYDPENFFHAAHPVVTA